MTTTTVKRIVCLANSRKTSGRCIAGKGLVQTERSHGARIGSWIRPVSTRPSEEVSEYERQYEDGSDPQLLDIIDVPLLRHRPKDYQQENWIIDNSRYWVRIDQFRLDQLDQITDEERQLWTNASSTYHGCNDRVHQDTAVRLRDSLRLIKSDDLTLTVFAPGEDFGNLKRRVQGRFQYKGIDYWLWVTDPNYERKYLQLPNGNYQVGKCFLTISLGELYDCYAYKFIAAIIRS
jgi:hypothetical protein